MQHDVGADRLHRSQRRDPVGAGSHHLRTPKYREVEGLDPIPAEMAKGSVLIWTGSLYRRRRQHHDTWRTGIAMNYCAGFIRQQENQYRHPPERMASFTPELREMCGLGVYRGLIGNIDKKSPAELLTVTLRSLTFGMWIRSVANSAAAGHDVSFVATVAAPRLAVMQESSSGTRLGVRRARRNVEGARGAQG